MTTSTTLPTTGAHQSQSQSPSPSPIRARRIVHRTAGHTRGPFTRLMSPGDVGEIVKPFVFLDYFEFMPGGSGMADHPHSGLATHTTLLSGGFTYRDSTGKSGHLSTGSVEWMQAGGGVWHGGNPIPGKKVRGYQLWVALPEALENLPAQSQYVDSSLLQNDGRVRVLLGQYGSLRSPIPDVASMTYLHVQLADGETWRYHTAVDHDVAWIAVNEGKAHVAGEVLRKEMAVLEDGNGAFDIRAEGATEFILGSAAKHPHPLVCGSYSVHTSNAALVRGETGIREVANRLRA